MEVIDYNENFLILRDSRFELFWHKQLKNYETHIHLTTGEFFDPNDPSYYFFKYVPQADDVVFDVGACEGMFGYLTKNVVKEVHLFEPIKLHCCAMKHTFKNDSNVTIHNVGISNENYTTTFGVNPEGCMGCGGESNNPNEVNNEVEITTIDTFCDKTKVIPTMIKVDTEGYEMKMLNGSINTLNKYHPKLIMSLYHNVNDHVEIPEFLTKCGYKNLFFGKQQHRAGFFDSPNGKTIPVLLYAEL